MVPKLGSRGMKNLVTKVTGSAKRQPGGTSPFFSSSNEYPRNFCSTSFLLSFPGNSGADCLLVGLLYSIDIRIMETDYLCLPVHPIRLPSEPKCTSAP